LENKTTLLEEIACHKSEILAIVEISFLTDRYQALTERTLSTKNKFEATKKRLPVLKQYFIHRDTSKGLVEWLTEINAVFQEPFNVDSLENLEREIEAHSATKVALQDRSKALEGTVANAKALEEAGTLSETDMKGTYARTYRIYLNTVELSVNMLCNRICIMTLIIYEKYTLYI
jgi:tetrahydromethanopterin S-methyltransferase subunit H